MPPAALPSAVRGALVLTALELLLSASMPSPPDKMRGRTGIELSKPRVLARTGGESDRTVLVSPVGVLFFHALFGKRGTDDDMREIRADVGVFSPFFIHLFEGRGKLLVRERRAT